MNGNNYYTICAIYNTSLSWIYMELVRDKQIIELLFEAEFLSAFFH